MHAFGFSFRKYTKEGDKMRELHIAQNDADQRVDKFLMKALPSLPKSLMYKFIRNKKIKVNKKRCEISQRLQCGDVIQCYIADAFFAVNKQQMDFLQVPDKLHVLYEDEQILVAYKPVNCLVQKDQTGIQDNMNDRLLHYLYKHQRYDPNKEQSFTPAFAHRLDRNTEGVLIAGKSAQALRCLNECLRNHTLEKRYLALVEGICEKERDELHFYYKKHGAMNKAEVFSAFCEGALPIHTDYRVLKTYSDCTLLEVILHTGKSHQIRASLAAIGHPLVGDEKYRANTQWKHRFQALCAYQLGFAGNADLGCLQYLQGKTFVLQDGELLRYLHRLGNVSDTKKS